MVRLEGAASSSTSRGTGDLFPALDWTYFLLGHVEMDFRTIWLDLHGADVSRYGRRNNRILGNGAGAAAAASKSTFLICILPAATCGAVQTHRVDSCSGGP
jgi:hypothetical protein